MLTEAHCSSPSNLNCMKRKIQTPNLDVLRAPAYPLSGREVFQRVRVALAESFGFQPGFPRLARLIGEKTNLTHYWFKVLPHPHVIAFLSFLEHLPEPKRRALLNQCCRELPRTDHVRLAHDPIAVSNLEGVLKKQAGITWIQGGTDFYRTFVLTALGHSFPQICGEHATVTGIDVHQPRKWVPVEGMSYLNEPLPVEKVRSTILKIWPSIRSGTAQLVLLNGVWAVAPQIHHEIVDLAASHHVVLTDAKMPERWLFASTVPTHVITLNEAREGEQWIRLRVNAAKR